MDDSSVHSLIDEIADDFLNRRLAGKEPTLIEYCEKYPELAEKIRDFFPALDLLDSIKPESEKHSSEQASQPQKIAHYSIERTIGRGGMGLVFEAVHNSLGRRVALKVVNQRLLHDANSQSRFIREARAIAKLHHTNIVPLFEVGEDAGQLFLAMQLIAGKGLDQAIVELREAAAEHAAKPWPRSDSKLNRSGSLSSTESSASHRRHFNWVAEIGMQVADALAYAHDRGVIHRDIKPSNLLLEDSGVVWLTDFGLAKTDDDELTQTGEFVGTLRYMAPEQFQGRIDERADVYSLGATLYELLGLQPAYAASDRLQLLSDIHNSAPSHLCELNPLVPRDLETIVMKAMEREPSARYQSAQAMADDLKRFIADEPILARRTSAVERLLRWRRRNKSLATALSAAGVLLVLLVAVLSWTTIRQAKLREISDLQRDDLQRNLYFSEMNVAGQAALQRHGVNTIQGRVENWHPKVIGRDLRHWEWYYLYAMSHRATFVSERLGNIFCWSCDHSPDGSRFVHTVNAWGIHVRDASSGKLLAEKYLVSARSVAWSPDGKWIAVGKFGEECAILDANTLETVTVLSVPNALEVRCVRWHPNSRWLAEAGRYRTPGTATEIRVHDTQSGKVLKRLAGHDGEVFHLSWDPSGNKLASSDRTEVIVWNHADETIELREAGLNAAWSPNGQMLACVRATGVWDLISEKQIASAEQIGSISWRPDSGLIAFGCNDGKIRVCEIETSRIIYEFLGHSSEIWSVSWSRDGRFLASCGLRDETVRTWDLNQQHCVRELAPSQDIFRAETENLADRIVGYTIFGGRVFIWNMSGDLLLERDFGHQVRDISASPDGNHIAVAGIAPVVTVWNTEEDSVVELETASEVFDLDWHNQGKLAAGLASGDIMIWDADGNAVRTLTAAHKHEVLCVDWKNNEEVLVSASTDSTMKLWNTDSGDLQWQAETPGAYPREIVFSDDGSILATAHTDALTLWDPVTGRRIRKLDDIREDFRSLDWSADNQRIVSGSRSSIALWDVRSGKVALRLQGQVDSVRWSSDGRQIVIGGPGVKVFDASRGYALNPPSD